MSLDKLINRDVVAQLPTHSCREAAEIMRERNVGCVVVVEDEEPVGIVTDRDLVVRVMAEGRDPSGVLLREIMSESPIFLSEKRDLGEVIDTMRELGVRRVPVVDAKHRLRGILSIDDVLMHLSREVAGVGQAIQRELGAASRN